MFFDISILTYKKFRKVIPTKFDLIGFPQWVLDREQLDIVLLVTNYPSDCLATCDGVIQSESMLQNPDQSQASCHPPYAARHTSTEGFVRFNICQSTNQTKELIKMQNQRTLMPHIKANIDRNKNMNFHNFFIQKSFLQPFGFRIYIRL